VSARAELERVAKLGQAAKLVAEDCGLELRDFAITPDLDSGEMNTVTIVLLLDPNNETKPKVETVQMEGAVSEAMAEAYRERMAERADKARRDLSQLDLEQRLKGRGGFLE